LRLNDFFLLLGVLLLGQVTNEGDVTTTFSTEETGDNGVFRQSINVVDAKEITVKFAGAGAVTELQYYICP
jgi:hypothetical protein